MSLKLKIVLFFIVAFTLLGAANNPKGDGLAVQGTDPTGNAGYPLAVVPATATDAFPVSGTFWQATQPVSLASMPSTPVTGTFWQATQPVSGTFWQATQPVSGTVTANQGGTWTVQPGNTANTTAWKVDGSAVTQPISAASLPTHAVTQSGTWTVQPGNTANTTAWKVDNSAVTQPVSGTFWQATQPVSGTFWQATQPVSGTVTANQGGTWTVQPGNTANTTAWKVDGSAVTQPVSGTVTANQGGTWTVQPGNTQNTTAWLVSPGNSTGKTNILKTGSATTTSSSADQVILTYTVTSGKTFYVEYLEISTRLTVLSATGTILGTVSLETPSGTKVFTDTQVNPTSEAVTPIVITFPEPIPVAAGVVIRVVCTPAATTSMLWTANFGGYEK